MPSRFVSRATRKTSEGLTNHVDGGSPGPHPVVLLDGVVEGGLTQLNSSHTDPEAQAEQPRHDRTHLLKSGRGGVTKIHHVLNLWPHPSRHTNTHTPPESRPKWMENFNISLDALWLPDLTASFSHYNLTFAWLYKYEFLFLSLFRPVLSPSHNAVNVEWSLGSLFPPMQQIPPDRLTSFNSWAVLLPHNQNQTFFLELTLWKQLAAADFRRLS